MTDIREGNLREGLGCGFCPFGKLRNRNKVGECLGACRFGIPELQPVLGGLALQYGEV